MNASSDFTKAVCLTLITNGSTIATLSETSDLWSQATLDLGNAWLHTTDAQLQDTLDGIDQADGETDPSSLQNFYGSFDEWSVNDWSMDAITELQTKTALYWDDSYSGVWNGMASQESSLIQSTSALNTSEGDAMAKACQSAIQNASSAGQPASDAGNSVVGVLSNTASVQAQISA